MSWKSGIPRMLLFRKATIKNRKPKQKRKRSKTLTHTLFTSTSLIQFRHYPNKYGKSGWVGQPKKSIKYSICWVRQSLARICWIFSIAIDTCEFIVRISKQYRPNYPLELRGESIISHNNFPSFPYNLWPSINRINSITSDVILIMTNNWFTSLVPFDLCPSQCRVVSCRVKAIIRVIPNSIQYIIVGNFVKLLTTLRLQHVNAHAQSIRGFLIPVPKQWNLKQEQFGFFDSNNPLAARFKGISITENKWILHYFGWRTRSVIGTVVSSEQTCA